MLIPFPFTDLSSVKVRPSVIVSDINNGDDVVVAFISSQNTKGIQKTDILIKSSSKFFKETGLKTDSVVKIGKMATLDKKIILGEIGKIDSIVEKEINKKIKLLFGF